MARSRAIFFALISAAICVLAGRCQAGVRDWAAHPAVLDLPQPGVLYVVSDPHGDVDTLATLLAGTHLIDEAAHSDAARWTAGSATLVCTGDLIDKYDQQLAVVALFRRLQTQAAADGGRVIVTMGNHEAEFLAGTRGDSDFARELNRNHVDPAAVVAGSDSLGIGQWMRNLPIAAKLGDWFFCHAGNTNGMKVEQLDAAAQHDIDAHGFDVPLLLGPDSLLEARMHPRPWWDYDGGLPELKAIKTVKEHDQSSSADPGEPRLRDNLRRLGVSHLVFGHQPGEIKFLDGTRRAAGAVYAKWDNTVILIDTGMSRGVASGRGAVLKIEGEHVSAMYADGQTVALP